MIEGDLKLEIRQPKLLTGFAMLVLNAFGFLAYVPVLAAFLIVSVGRLGWKTYAIPLGVFLVTTFFLPFIFGNAYVARLGRKLNQGSPVRAGEFLVQLKLRPRLKSGLRAMIDDADDIGWLLITPQGFEFRGDAVTVAVPRGRIITARQRSIGWHGLFLTGPRLEYEVRDAREFQIFEFTERASWLIPDSRRIARKMYEEEKTAASQTPAAQ